MLDMTFRPLATGHWYEIWNPGLPSHSESFQPASEVSRLMVTNKTESSFKCQLSFFAYHLRRRGYPMSLVRQVFHGMPFSQRHCRLHRKFVPKASFG